MIGEAKSLDVPLHTGYDQVLDYLNGGSVASHEWPRFIIVTNFEEFRLDRLGDEPWTVHFTIDELPDYLEQLLFFAGVETLTNREQENASIEAANLMANLFNTLVGEEADEYVGDDAPINPEDEEDSTELASVLVTRRSFPLCKWRHLRRREASWLQRASRIQGRVVECFPVTVYPLHKT